MRFRAPARDDVAPEIFEHPAFRGFAHRALLSDAAWPQIDDLNRLLSDRVHLISNVKPRFVAQTPGMLADGKHYESRIFDTGMIATRPESWHDLFNALMWIERFELKCAINAAYVRELGVLNVGPRTRAQCALTHFDEGGAIVTLTDPGLLACWDAHDWRSLFFEQRARWDSNARVLLFGHAMLEHRLVPNTLSVAKCLVVEAGPTQSSTLMRVVARQIVAGRLLRDPQELRPLPLAGLTDWHPDNRTESFYRDAPCFRPLRAERRYPPAFPLSGDIYRSLTSPKLHSPNPGKCRRAQGSPFATGSYVE